MKLRMLLFTIAVAGALVLSIGRSDAQDKAKSDAKPPADMQAMMKKGMEFATPGEGHKLLETLVGKWDIVTRMWWQGPGKPPNESKGISERKWVLEGRFLLEESSGQMMGMPYKSMSFLGFDNYKKKYVVSYLDSIGTAMYTGEGKFDPSNKVMTMFGKMDDYIIGESDKPVKYVTRLVSKDKQVFEIYDEVGSPNEYKAVEIIYTRKP